MTSQEVERLLPQFEGLVFETARQIVAQGVELEFDDVRQLLRMKIWRAIERHDTDHVKRMSLPRFVFMCVTNLRKDLETRRPRRYNSSIEAIRDRRLVGEAGEGGTLADWFDGRYLSTDADQVYFEVEDEPVRLPSTLDATERTLIALRLEGRPLYEIERTLGLSRAQRERALHSIREKLADWQPSPPRGAPMRPLPDAQPRGTPVRVLVS